MTTSVLTETSGGRCCCPYFTDEETEVQRVQATCPRPHSEEAVEQGRELLWLCFYSLCSLQFSQFSQRGWCYMLHPTDVVMEKNRAGGLLGARWGSEAYLGPEGWAFLLAVSPGLDQTLLANLVGKSQRDLVPPPSSAPAPRLTMPTLCRNKGSVIPQPDSVFVLCQALLRVRLLVQQCP